MYQGNVGTVCKPMGQLTIQGMYRECKRLFCLALSLLDCINIAKMNEKTRFRMKSDKAEKGFR